MGRPANPRRITPEMSASIYESWRQTPTLSLALDLFRFLLSTSGMANPPGCITGLSDR
jgi:hypothetical protein